LLAAWTRPIEFHSSDQFSDIGFRVGRLSGEQFEPGDVNGDGSVDVDDLIAVILAWGPCPAPPADCPADVNNSGAVDVDDLIMVILNWG
jgi:hypothetical protein